MHFSSTTATIIKFHTISHQHQQKDNRTSGSSSLLVHTTTTASKWKQKFMVRVVGCAGCACVSLELLFPTRDFFSGLSVVECRVGPQWPMGCRDSSQRSIHCQVLDQPTVARGLKGFLPPKFYVAQLCRDAQLSLNIRISTKSFNNGRFSDSSCPSLHATKYTSYHPSLSLLWSVHSKKCFYSPLQLRDKVLNCLRS